MKKSGSTVNNGSNNEIRRSGMKRIVLIAVATATMLGLSGCCCGSSAYSYSTTWVAGSHWFFNDEIVITTTHKEKFTRNKPLTPYELDNNIAAFTFDEEWWPVVEAIGKAMEGIEGMDLGYSGICRNDERMYDYNPKQVETSLIVQGRRRDIDKVVKEVRERLDGIKDSLPVMTRKPKIKVKKSRNVPKEDDMEYAEIKVHPPILNLKTERFPEIAGRIEITTMLKDARKTGEDHLYQFRMLDAFGGYENGPNYESVYKIPELHIMKMFMEANYAGEMKTKTTLTFRGDRDIDAIAEDVREYLKNISNRWPEGMEGPVITVVRGNEEKVVE